MIGADLPLAKQFAYFGMPLCGFRCARVCECILKWTLEKNVCMVTSAKECKGVRASVGIRECRGMSVGIFVFMHVCACLCTFGCIKAVWGRDN